MATLPDPFEVAIEQRSSILFLENRENSDLRSQFLSARFSTETLQPSPLMTDSSTSVRWFPSLILISLSHVDVITGEPVEAYWKFLGKLIAEHTKAGAFILVIDPMYPGVTRQDIWSTLIENSTVQSSEFRLACAHAIRDPSGTILKWLVSGRELHDTQLAKKLLGCLSCELAELSSLEAVELACISSASLLSVWEALCQQFRVAYQGFGCHFEEVFSLLEMAPGVFPQSVSHLQQISSSIALAWALRRRELPRSLLEDANRIWDTYPSYVVSRVNEILNDHGKPLSGSRILVIGVHDRKVDDIASGDLQILRSLLTRKAVVNYHDTANSKVIGEKLREIPDLAPLPIGITSLNSQDLVLILYPVPGCDWGLIAEQSKIIVDAARVMKFVKGCRENLFPI